MIPNHFAVAFGRAFIDNATGHQTAILLLAMPVRIALVAAVFVLLHLVGLGGVDPIRRVFDLDEFAVEIRSRRFAVQDNIAERL